MKSIRFTDAITFSWKVGTTRLNEYYYQYFGDSETVSTEVGQIKGYKISSSFDFNYFNFNGIPYAQPPVGDLRFKDPQPLEPTPDKVINTDFMRGGSMACQDETFSDRPGNGKKNIGNENCLHLSIYTRDLKPETPKPVMIWIHGGGFTAGSNSKNLYDPEFLLRKDVVVCTINYRVGAFGFLSLNEPSLEVAGNAGLKDQVMALKWIKKHCSAFGGDADNITLFGESAGGASVSYHMISEMSKGLFNKAISMSGTQYAPWALNTITDWTQRLAKKLGWHGEDGESGCLNFLRTVTPEKIVKAQTELLTPEETDRHVLFSFGPSVEPYEGEQCFISKEPLKMARNAWSNDIPLILGGCSCEGLIVYNTSVKQLKASKNVDLVNVLPLDEFRVDVNNTLCQSYAEKIQRFYFGFAPISMETIQVYSMLLGDKLFWHSIHREVLRRVDAKSASTYLYRFDFDGELNFIKRLFADKKIRGASHGDDMMYLFKSVFNGIPNLNSNEWKMVERMVDAWTLFARTGNPNGESNDAVDWKPLELERSSGEISYKCMNFDAETTFSELPELERMPFWDEIYSKFDRDLF